MSTSGPDPDQSAPSGAGRRSGAGDPGAENADITGFVRETLGCTCPDEVFEHIATARLAPDRIRLDIGGRLLVHIVAGAETAGIGERLSDWVRDGIAERDRRGMNRFRLVLGAGEPDTLRAAAEPVFAMLADGDKRAHLHCPHNAALRPLLAAPPSTAGR